jgi:hypothetical protein
MIQRTFRDRAVRTLILIIVLILVLAGQASGAMSLVQKAAMKTLDKGCTTRMSEGDYNVFTRGISKTWQEGGKKCRMIRIIVHYRGQLVYNGVQRICEP